MVGTWAVVGAIGRAVRGLGPAATALGAPSLDSVAHARPDARQLCRRRHDVRTAARSGVVVGPGHAHGNGGGGAEGLRTMGCPSDAQHRRDAKVQPNREAAPQFAPLRQSAPRSGARPSARMTRVGADDGCCAMAESEGDTEAEFRQYLVQSQAATELLKVLVGLEEADPKPENPVQFLTDFFGSQARRRCILWLSRALAASRPDE